MSKIKKFKNEVKRLKKKAEKAEAQKEALKQKIKQLKSKITARDKELSDLRLKLADDSPSPSAPEAESQALGGIQKKGVATDQREAWKKFSYLRSRYEHYLSEDSASSDARILANDDLITKFGEEAGYTESELLDILT